LKVEDGKIGEAGYPKQILFILLILFHTNGPTWKSALRATGTPVSKPAK
jgi:hypothetical protein